MKNIVILISGRGSNMEAVVRALDAEGWPARIAAVISNKPEAGGLAFAQARGIPTAVVPSKSFATRAEFDAKLQETIDVFEPDLVASPASPITRPIDVSASIRRYSARSGRIAKP